MHSKTFLGLALALFFSACEKDDICDGTQSTPQLVIEFYDSNNPTVNKTVNQLLVQAPGQSKPLGTYTGVSKIKIPLAITADQTTYAMSINANSTTAINTDFITLHYTRQTQYVSRACGYKMVFYLDQNTPLEQQDNTPADTYWMKQIIVKTNAITNDSETHVKVYL